MATRNVCPAAFVNKMDRPAMNGFEIIEQLEKEFGLQSYPVTWPVGSGEGWFIGQGAWLAWLGCRHKSHMTCAPSWLDRSMPAYITCLAT